MLVGCPVWLAGDWVPMPLRAIVYPFFHANIFHLAVNALSVWAVFRPGLKRNTRDLILGMAISAIAYPMGFRPCVGISNVLFAVSGMRSQPLSNHKWWLQPVQLTCIATMVAMCFFPQFSGTNHICAYVIGVAVSYVIRRIEKAESYVRKLEGNR